jgi:hypothetical protein
MKRKLAWACLLVSPLVIGGAVFFLPDPDPITQANCAKIRKGMTKKDVVGILGRQNDWELHWGTTHVFIWNGATGRIGVQMEFTDNPIFVATAEFTPSRPHILERIKDWLGL